MGELPISLFSCIISANNKDNHMSPFKKLQQSFDSGAIDSNILYSFLMENDFGRVARFTESECGTKEYLTLSGFYRYRYNKKSGIFTAFRRKFLIKGGKLSYDWVSMTDSLQVSTVFVPHVSNNDSFDNRIYSIVNHICSDFYDLGVKGLTHVKRNDAGYGFTYNEYGRFTSLWSQDWLSKKEALSDSNLFHSYIGRLKSFIDTDAINYGFLHALIKTQHWIDRRLVSIFMKIYCFGSRGCSNAKIYLSKVNELRKKKVCPELYDANKQYLPYLSLIKPKHFGKPEVFHNSTFLALLKENKINLSRGELRILLKQSPSVSKHMINSLKHPYNQKRKIDHLLRAYTKVLRIPGFDELPAFAKINLLRNNVIDRYAAVLARCLSHYSELKKISPPKDKKRYYTNIIKEFDHVVDWAERAMPAPQIHKNQDWLALVSQSVEWTRKMKELAKIQNDEKVWDPTGIDFEYKGIAVKELYSGKALLKEGEEMRHCVVGFTDDCMIGAYRVFSLESTTERTTLGITCSGYRSFEIQQHKGYKNEMGSMISREMKEAAKMVEDKLNLL